MWIRSWWQLSSSLTPPIKLGVASLCVCAPFTTLSGAVILVLWQLSSGRGSLALLFFSRSFFYLLGYCEQPESSQLAVFWRGVVTATEYNLQLLKLIRSCRLCRTKMLLCLIIIWKTTWSEVLWRLIGYVWIKGGLILTAHLFKLLKRPSWNFYLLPDNGARSQITPCLL